MFKNIEDCLSCLECYPDLEEEDIINYLDWIEGETMFLADFDRAKNDTLKACISVLFFLADMLRNKRGEVNGSESTI